MINSVQDLRYNLTEDLKRYGGKAPSIKDRLLHNEAWYIYHLLRHIRYMEYYMNTKGRNNPLFLWHFFRYKRLSFKLNITIYPNTVGAGLRIYHAGGFIHIGPNCKIGSNCTLLPGVVFGNKHEEANEGEVLVGDNCYFGLGARIFGPLTIGNNVTVGANAVVTKDIPDNAVVGGVPAKVIKIK